LRRSLGVDGPLPVTLISSGLIQALSIVTGIVLARVLGPEQRGELGTIILWPSVVATIAIVGLPDAVAVLVASRSMTFGDALRTALTVVALLAGAALIVVVGILIVVTAEMSPSAKLGAAMYVAFLPINMVTLTLVGALTGSQRFVSLNTVRVSVVAVAALGLPLLALSGSLTVASAAAVYIAANLVALGISIAAVRRLRTGEGGSATRQNATRLLDYGVRSQAGVVAGLVGERLDQLAISAFLPSREFGLYLAAIALTSGCAIVSTSVVIVLVPKIAALSGELRLAEARRYLRMTGLLTAAIAILTAAAAPILMTVLFGTAFGDASLPAQVLLLGAIPLALSRVLGAVSRACGQPWAASRAEWLALLAAVPAYALLLPVAGIIGAAWASVIAYASLLIIQAVFARSALGAQSVLDLVRRGPWETPIPRPERLPG
jgi:O-antigen/teichoic acid export membrane protein